jgi:hypothetical protein
MNKRKVKISIGEISQGSLHCMKRTVALIVILLALFVAFQGLAAKDVQAQLTLEPLLQQGIPPQIHLELDPDTRITATIQDNATISGDSNMPLQNTPADSSEEVATSAREKVEPDWSGLKRDSLYFVGYQVVVIGLLYIMPQAVSGWTSEQKRSFNFNKWMEKVSETEFDEDDWYLNYLVHPYWGATYYIRARERGFNKFHSFLYSAFLSTLYECGAEAFFEPPSIQDLIITPTAGSLLGIYFEKVREKIKTKGAQQRWYDKMVLVLTDPLGMVSKYTDRLLGIQGTVELKSLRSSPYQYEGININHLKSDKFDMADMVSKSPLGVEIKLAW